MMGLEQRLVMSGPGLISIDNDLAVSKRIYQSLGLMFRDDADNLFSEVLHPATFIQIIRIAERKQIWGKPISCGIIFQD